MSLSWTGEVSIPKAVDREMTQQDHLWRSRQPAWIHVQELTASYKAEAEAWEQAGLLGYGEAEGIALARQVKAHWFLTDDAGARLFAQTLGIEVHGSVGIVLWAAVIGHLIRTDTEAALDRRRNLRSGSRPRF